MAVVLLLPALIRAQEEDRNSFSIMAGAWVQDQTYFYQQVKTAWGPVLALEYQRELNDYFALRMKAFIGKISRAGDMEADVHGGISAGILVTPFGARLRNLKIGLSPAWLSAGVWYTNPNSRAVEKVADDYFALEVPVRFNVIDNSHYYISLGLDNLFYTNHGGGIFTSHALIGYGLKF